MQARKTNRLPCQRPLIAALAALASCSAWAEDPSPFYIGVTQSLTRDSNVNRLSDSVVDPQGRSDTYSSTGLVGGFDQPIGRQNFHGTADIRYNRYQNHDNLDNTSYGVNAGWDWATLYNISGGVNVSANQSLAQLNGNTTAPTTAANTSRNLVKTDQVGANVAWGGTGLLSVQGGYTHSRVRFSDQSNGSGDSSGDAGSIGVNYNISPDLTTGVAYRLTRTDAALSGSSDGRNIDLSVNWRYTVQTGVNARLSFTRQSNAGGGGQDFSGLTGSIAANYAPTGKLAFNLSYNRDAGTNGSFFNAPTSTGATTPVTQTTPILFENSTVADSVSLGATYSATAKINVNAGYQYRKSRVTNGSSAGGTDYDDKLQTASLGASWAVARAWQLSCNLSHEKRDTSSAAAFAYTANIVNCVAQLTFR